MTARGLQAVNARFAPPFAQAHRLVPGEGSEDARLVLIGEAPGAQEEAQGRPFVGTAGKNLDAFLQGVALDRAALYVTNAVKYRPTKAGKSGRLSNRTPTRAEVDAFRPWLRAELDCIRPQVIVTLGNTALRAVLGDDAPVIGAVHGVAMETEAGVVFPLYHPASIIYRRELLPVYETDVKNLHAYLQQAQG